MRKIKKLTDKQFYELKKGTLVIEDNHAEEYRILAEVVAVKPGQSVTLRRIRFLPPADSEDCATGFLETFEPQVTISRTDTLANLFRASWILEPNETPVTNSWVSYFKTTVAAMVCQCV